MNNVAEENISYTELFSYYFGVGAFFSFRFFSKILTGCFPTRELTADPTVAGLKLPTPVRTRR